MDVTGVVLNISDNKFDTFYSQHIIVVPIGTQLSQEIKKVPHRLHLPTSPTFSNSSPENVKRYQGSQWGSPFQTLTLPRVSRLTNGISIKILCSVLKGPVYIERPLNRPPTGYENPKIIHHGEFRSPKNFFSPFPRKLGKYTRLLTSL